ncbi:pyridoxal phosphate-dependent transferase [Geopyxis carbonaria]|nr:pyridoxal phosphate-dependent transferase [Geopyxis carbonaria]
MAAFSIPHSRQKFAIPLDIASAQTIFFENAGGTQCLTTVADAMHDYMTKTNVQIYATYHASKVSTKLFEDGHKAAAKFVNAAPEDIVIGPSTTQNLANLANAIDFPPGSELIVSKIDHEANISPWVRVAAQRGLVLKWWTLPSDSKSTALSVADLKALLTPKTRLVTCTHCSNVLGTINPIAAIAAAVHEIPGALLCVDGVAMAAHRRTDVAALGVDFYTLSWYKVFGPHCALLYAAPGARAGLHSLGHYFNQPADGANATLTQKLGLAGASYELVAPLPKILDYLGPDLDAAYAQIAAHEERLAEVLLSSLSGRPGITVHGEHAADRAVRVAVVSFSVAGWNAYQIVDAIERRTLFGVRAGHCYAHRLVTQVLGFAADDGVVRVSLVHYNTLQEVYGFVAFLKRMVFSE